MFYKFYRTKDVFSSSYRWKIPFSYTTGDSANFNVDSTDVIWLDEDEKGEIIMFCVMLHVKLLFNLALNSPNNISQGSKTLVNSPTAS